MAISKSVYPLAHLCALSMCTGLSHPKVIYTFPALLATPLWETTTRRKGKR